MTDTSNVKRDKRGAVVCIVSFEAAEVASAEEAAIKKLGGSITVKGFRPGAAPTDVLKENIDAPKLQDETIRGLLPDTFEKLIQEHEIEPIISPSIEIEKEDPLTIKVTFTERPTVKLKNIGKITVESEEATVDPKDIDRMVDYVLKQHQTSTDVDRPAQEGDRLTIDFTGTKLDGTEIPEITSEDYPTIIGSNVMLPGFEDELKGLKTGDTKDFPITFPEKHEREDLRGKPVTFHVTVKRVEELHTPELDDAFAKEHLHVESVEEFKKNVEESMLTQEKQFAKEKAQDEAFKKLVEATTVDLSEQLIASEEQSLMEEFSSQLQKQNMTIGDWLDQTGKDPDEARKEFAEQAERRLKLRLGMRAFIDEKSIEATDEEVDAYIEKLAFSDEQRGSMQKGSEHYEQVKWQVLVEKVLDEIIVAPKK